MCDFKTTIRTSKNDGEYAIFSKGFDFESLCESIRWFLSICCLCISAWAWSREAEGTWQERYSCRPSYPHPISKVGSSISQLTCVYECVELQPCLEPLYSPSKCSENTLAYINTSGDEMRSFLILRACCSVAKSWPTRFDPMDCSTPGSSVLHYRKFSNFTQGFRRSLCSDPSPSQPLHFQFLCQVHVLPFCEYWTCLSRLTASSFLPLSSRVTCRHSAFRFPICKVRRWTPPPRALPGLSKL